MAQSVEHVLGKDEVTSSSLVSSSRKTAEKSAVFSIFLRTENRRKIIGYIFKALWLHDFRSFEGLKMVSLFEPFRDGIKLPKTTLLATFGYTWLHENRGNFPYRKPPRK